MKDTDIFEFDASTGSITGLTEAGEQLTEINIPAQIDGVDVKNIGNYAVWECKKLQSVTILESVTNIGYSAFMDCKRLASITLPEGLTSIGRRAFENCDSLKKITIPESVTNIGDDAFAKCNNLVSVTIQSNRHGSRQAIIIGGRK